MPSQHGERSPALCSSSRWIRSPALPVTRLCISSRRRSLERRPILEPTPRQHVRRLTADISRPRSLAFPAAPVHWHRASTLEYDSTSQYKTIQFQIYKHNSLTTPRRLPSFWVMSRHTQTYLLSKFKSAIGLCKKWTHQYMVIS